MTKEEIKKVIDELPNKKWKQYFTENEFEKIANSMYNEYKIHSNIDYEFGMYLNASLFMLSTEDGKDAIREKYLNNNG